MDEIQQTCRKIEAEHKPWLIGTDDVLFTPRHLALAVKAGACEDAVAWVKEHPGCTWGDLQLEWRGWYAVKVAVPHCWYAQARALVAESDDPAWWSGECAGAAAKRGDEAEARRFISESDDPAEWSGECAGAAARRGDYTQARCFISQSDDRAYWSGLCALAAAKRGDEAEAARFRKEAK